MARVAVVFCLLLAVVGIAGKIIGGRDTEISEVPYLVSLQFKSNRYCGGSILGPRYILTAAHCVEKEETSSDVHIRAGSSFYHTGGEIRKVIKIMVHSKYDNDTLDNDIAILKLDAVLAFNTNIKSIALSGSEPEEKDQVLVSGWGATKEGGTSSKMLQSVSVPVVTRESCRKSLGIENPVTENMFCAGYLSGGKDSCSGDSGGPAIVKGRLAGIISWGVGCGRKNTPGVYTNIVKYRSWIRTQIH